MALNRRYRLAVLLTAGLALAGCKDTRIVSYRVAKETPSNPPAMTAADPGSAIHWQTPSGWEEQPAGGMRQGSFTVPGPDGTKADMSVITFPGDVGGDLANLNRWRGQLGLPPVGAAELPDAFAKVKAPAGEFLVADLVGQAPSDGGTEPPRILGAILAQTGQTWFFKLSGQDKLVESQKPTFLSFLQSVRFTSAAGAPPASGRAQTTNTNDLPPDARGVPAQGALAADTLPPGHPPIGGGAAAAGAAMSSAPVPVAGGEALTWTAPPQWTPTAGSAMRKGSYAVKGPEGVGDLSITAFPGDVGGDLANVNRWRGQLDLPPVSNLAGAVQTLDAHGLHMVVFDGANAGQAILGAIVPLSGQTWFFKLTGPDQLVAREKATFLDFLKTVKAP